MPIDWNRGYDIVLAVRNTVINQLLSLQHERGHFFHSKWLNIPFSEVDPGTLADGVVGLQLSPPRIHAVAGDNSRLSLGFDVRSLFKPREASAPAPETLHGNLSASARLSVYRGGDDVVLWVDLDAPDITVEFDPAPGSPTLAGAYLQSFEASVRDFLANGVEPVNHRFETPTIEGLGLSTVDFRTYGYGNFQAGGIPFSYPEATALLLNMSSSTPSGSDPDTVGNPLSRIGSSDDFRDIGASLDAAFLNEVIREKAAGPLDSIAFTFQVLDLYATTVNYTVRVDSDSLDIELRDNGTIRVRVSGTLKTSFALASDYNWNLRQDFAIFVSGGQIFVERSGEPHISVNSSFASFFQSEARAQVRPALDTLAAEAGGVMNGILANIEQMLLDGLDIPEADLEVTEVHVDSGALRLMADLELPPLGPVVANWSGKRWIDEVNGAQETAIELSAFKSWAPGGTIRKLKWSWSNSAISGEHEDPNSFFYRLVREDYDPDSPWWLNTEITLEVEGIQPDDSAPGGARISTATDTAWFKYYPPREGTPDWEITIDHPGGKLGEIDGHSGIPLSAHRQGGPALGLATLVEYYPDKAAALEEIKRALDKEGRIGPLLDRIATVVIYPDDTRELAAARKGYPGFAYGVDRSGGWARLLGAGQGEVTVLFDGKGKELWRQEGGVDARSLQRALVEHVTGMPVTGEWRRVALEVETGQKAPDFLFDYNGRQIGLRKFTGRSAALFFWKSWSDVCLDELKLLAGGVGDKGPLVLAICDGEGGTRAVQALETLGIDVQVVPDPERAISARYGVSVWPTTVLVNQVGQIAGIQIGRFHRDVQLPTRPEGATD